MKLSALVLAAGLVGATAVEAAPYYVGENLAPENNVSLGFNDTPTKEDVAAGRADTGNIAAFELEGVYNIIPDLAAEINLPFYMLTEDATALGNSRSALGNLAAGANWSRVVSESNENVQWGYTLAADIFLPTSRKDEAGTVAGANPTTEFYRYGTKTTSFHPHAGLFLDVDQVEAKTNFGYGYSYVAGSGINDRNRNSFTWQTALSYTPIEVLAVNLEYNAIIFDERTSGAGKRYRHALTPGISGNYDQVMGQAFTTIPLDTTTRDLTNVAFGLNVGYMF